MNVIKDLLSNGSHENVAFAIQLSQGIVKNAFYEIVDENFGNIYMDDGENFMISFMLDFKTIEIYNFNNEYYKTNIGGMPFQFHAFQVMKDVDYDESKVKERLMHMLKSCENYVNNQKNKNNISLEIKS